MILRNVFCTGRGQQIRTGWNVMVRPWCPCNFYMLNAAAVPFVLQLDSQAGSAGNAMSRFSL